MTDFDLDFDFDFWFCPAGLTGRALLLFLTSPPRMFLDGGVRSGTVARRPLRVRAGQQGTRAQRGYTVDARAVGVLCLGCVGIVRADLVMPTVN